MSNAITLDERLDIAARLHEATETLRLHSHKCNTLNEMGYWSGADTTADDLDEVAEGLTALLYDVAYHGIEVSE